MCTDSYAVNLAELVCNIRVTDLIDIIFHSIKIYNLQKSAQTERDQFQHRMQQMTNDKQKELDVIKVLITTIE